MNSSLTNNSRASTGTLSFGIDRILGTSFNKQRKFLGVCFNHFYKNKSTYYLNMSLKIIQLYKSVVLVRKLYK